MCNIKVLSLLVRKLWLMLKFFKIRSNFKVKVRRSKIMLHLYHVKGFDTRNEHVQYESPITHGREVMTKDKVRRELKISLPSCSILNKYVCL